jgi:hypothetical protein
MARATDLCMPGWPNNKALSSVTDTWVLGKKERTNVNACL